MTVRTYPDVVSAHLGRAKLDDAGIAAFVLDENLISVQWLYATALGGVKLKVAKRDAEEAIRVLSQFDGSALTGVSESHLPPTSGDQCPRCGAETVRGSRLFRSTLAISLWTNVPLYLWRQRWYCDSCGFAWKMQPEARVETRQATRDAEQQVKGAPNRYPGILAYILVLAILLVGFLAKEWSAA